MLLLRLRQWPARRRRGLAQVRAGENESSVACSFARCSLIKVAPLPLVQPPAQVGDEFAVAHELRNAQRLVLLNPQLVQNRACAQVTHLSAQASHMNARRWRTSGRARRACAGCLASLRPRQRRAGDWRNRSRSRCGSRSCSGLGRSCKWRRRQDQSKQAFLVNEWRLELLCLAVFAAAAVRAHLCRKVSRVSTSSWSDARPHANKRTSRNEVFPVTLPVTRPPWRLMSASASSLQYALD